MQTDETLIPQVIRLFEEKTGWGDSINWTNQDFLRLSDLIREQTGVTLSHVTLKRVWGKVKYDSLPNTHTLNTLVQFLGYTSWRDFSVRQTQKTTLQSQHLPLHTQQPPSNQHEQSQQQTPNPPGAFQYAQPPAPNPPGASQHSQQQTPNSQEPSQYTQSPIASSQLSTASTQQPTPNAPEPSQYNQSVTASPQQPTPNPLEPSQHPQQPRPEKNQPSSQISPVPSTTSTAPSPTRSRPKLKKKWIFIPLFVLLPLLLLLLHGQQPAPQPGDYAFSSKKVVTSGLPNSVVFDYDATRSPDDSVIIQQSWDTTRRVKVSKNDHQHTSLYYYPDFYHATLQVHNRVVKSHNILIGTNGWLSLIEQDPVPVYFKKEQAIHDGKISVSVDQVKQSNIQLQPSPPTVMITNVRDFGDIYSDHFTFETSLRNDYAEGSAACQLSRIYLLCEGTAIWIPICSKGCISTVDLFFTYYYTTGKREDLSAFGVPTFDNYVKLRIESDSGQGKIFVDDKLAYTVNRHIIRSKIIGIMYRFQGAGSVDYVSLSNGKLSYREDFN